MKIDEMIQMNIQNWIKIHNDKNEIEQLQKTNPEMIIDSFYKNLEFGTGGLRGLMGIGTNRINSYTISMATQAFANHLKNEHPQLKKITVVIGFDTRKHSREFAEETAQVLAGNGIYVLLSKNPMPTPLVSYACKFYQCQGAVMITASHNPPNYNGYKVYWSDGGQVLPPHDEAIINEFSNLLSSHEILKVKKLDDPLISQFGEELLESYLKILFQQQIYPKDNKEHGNLLKVTYSSLHGTGIFVVPKSLQSWGFNKINIVEKQANSDGSFFTVKFPNPETKEALHLGIEQMLSTNSDLFIATDPDSDRLGVVINQDNKAIILTGNEVACLCLNYLCLNLKNIDFKKYAVIKSIVTTELFVEIAKNYNLSHYNVLPGFKYIAQLIEKWENEKTHKFLFGCEESLGYLYGDFVRDKDAISTSNLICEMALQAKLNKKTLKDSLKEIYEKYGFYHQEVKSIQFEESKEAHDSIKKIMNSLIEKPPTVIGNKKVITLEDYSRGICKDFEKNIERKLNFPPSKLLIIFLEDHSKIMIRPSGTEPKIKIYCEVHRYLEDFKEESINDQCLNLANFYIHSVEDLIIQLK